MADLVDTLDHPPVAFGANCGTGACDLLRTLRGFAAQKPTSALIAKGNAGIPKYVDGHIHYDGTPDLLADYAVMARNSGAKLLEDAVVLCQNTSRRCALRWKPVLPIRHQVCKRSKKCLVLSPLPMMGLVPHPRYKNACHGTDVQLQADEAKMKTNVAL